MNLNDINIASIRTVIEKLGREFHTKDVSEHNLMIKSHSIFIAEYAYHSVVGRVSGRNTTNLNIKYIDEGNERGALWRKV